MEFLNQNMQTIIVTAVIVALLLIVVAVWRAFSPRVAGGRRGQRIGISEYYEVDKLRRLVIVRRDNVEHLVLIGGPQDIVIEAGIGAAPAAPSYVPSYAPASSESVQPGTARPAPRAPVFKTQPIRQGEAPPAAGRTREDPEL